MSELLVDITDPKVIESGLAPGLHALQAPAWIDGVNVLFEDGAVRATQGYISVVSGYTSTSYLSGVMASLSNGISNLAWGDNANLYNWNEDDGKTTEGTGYVGGISRAAFQTNAFQASAFQLTGTGQDLWMAETWGTWILETNGVDVVQVNKFDSTGFNDLAGSPPICKVLRRINQYMLAFNLDSGGSTFGWCNTDDVENWTTGAANTLQIRDMDSDIIAAERLGDVILAYSHNSMAVVEYVGPPFYFGAKKKLEGIGAVGRKSVVERGNYHYGISKQGIWQCDGTSFEYISPPLLRKYIEDNFVFGNQELFAGSVNEDRTTIEWGYEDITGNKGTVCFNVENRRWTFKSWKTLDAIKKGVFDKPVWVIAEDAGQTPYKVVFGEYFRSADAEQLTGFVVSKPYFMRVINPIPELEWKFLEYIKWWFRELKFEGADFVRVQVCLGNRLKDMVGELSATKNFPFFPTSNFTGESIEDGEPQFFSVPSGISSLDRPPFAYLPDGKFIQFYIDFGLSGAAEFQLTGLQAFGNYTGSDT